MCKTNYCAECARYAQEVTRLSARVTGQDDEIAAAKKDTERLDWLDEHHERLVDALMTQWIAKRPLRAAIDDAKGE